MIILKKFKKGDIVARKSYGKDIIFYIKKIIKNSNSEVAILCGLFERIEADSSVDDLELLDHNFVKKMFQRYFENARFLQILERLIKN
mgnify:CR=1 FL=1